MKIEMEFQGLEELVKAFEKAADDNKIRAVNRRIKTVLNWFTRETPETADSPA